MNTPMRPFSIMLKFPRTIIFDGTLTKYVGPFPSDFAALQWWRANAPQLNKLGIEAVESISLTSPEGADQ